MKLKFFQVLAILCLLCAKSNLFAQCVNSAYFISTRYAIDTTFYKYGTDTGLSTSGYTYNWVFTDGTVLSGPVVEYPFAVSGGMFSFTLTTTDPGGCASTFLWEENYAHFVFKCNFTSVWESSFFSFGGPIVIIDPLNINTTTVSATIAPEFSVDNLPDLTATKIGTIDWGNGTTTTREDYFEGVWLSNPPHYLYGGEYNIAGSMTIRLGTLICPSMPLSQISARLPGPLATPLISGDTTYCVGDTLRLVASDTTLQFHNMFHNADTAGSGDRGYVAFDDADDAFHPYVRMSRSPYSFEWLDRNMNLLSTDTVLIINGLSLSDSGDYIFHIHENALYARDSFYHVHINVQPTPVAGNITGPAAVCVGSTVTLSNAVGGGIWYSSFGVTTSGGVVTGISPGTTLVVNSHSNSCGMANDTFAILVNPLPHAGAISGVGTVCVGSTITVSADSAGGTWSVVNTHASVSAGTITGLTAGADTIIYTVTNGCGSDNTILPVTVNPLPDAGNITGPTSVCVGSAITLSNMATGGIWYSSFGVTVIGGVVTGVIPGTSMIVYSHTNSCGMANDTFVIAVNPLPFAGDISGVTTLCVGTTLTISTDSIGGIWGVTNSSASLVSGAVTGVLPGLDTITYSLTNGCGTSTSILPIIVDAVPVVGVITGPDTLCASATDTLFVGLAGGIWSNTTGVITVSAAGVVAPVFTGADTIVYIVTNACGADTAYKIIAGSEPPIVFSSYGVDTLCEGISGTFTVTATGPGTWSSGSPSIATVSSSGLVTAISAGAVLIGYIVTNSCGVAVVDFILYVKSAADCQAGIADNIGNKSISIFPNPNSGSFIVNLPVSTTAVITVMDITGKKMGEITSAANEVSIPVSIPGLPSGAYFVKVVAGGKTYYDKVVIW
ncbi:hypothetical protein CJD36_018580 [Flavipsychrobacter stenotrophus]|uniref:Secretion system C-terminal sorting domain-containing protein n=1 Tax=Flavipsychrobacter stenotrophus TaxID=2077091 RepID=A0A2S7SRT0_9BACT|nr:T9SS type A sorting domain-containing protein [Flavipsychrobacter stenotrophus]PQJ09256.1 hypothetical protein CJD36_018580 [Flavipsychrobacter stenotrophus]